MVKNGKKCVILHPNIKRSSLIQQKTYKYTAKSLQIDCEYLYKKNRIYLNILKDKHSINL